MESIIYQQFPIIGRTENKTPKISNKYFGKFNLPVQEEVQYRLIKVNQFIYSRVTDQSLSKEQQQRLAENKAKEISTKFRTLSQNYQIRNVAETKSFLLNNRFLISLLEEIPEKISQYFGDNQKPVLKVSYEPEYVNSAELWVEILTKLSAKEAMRILDKFDEEWWLEKIDKTYGRLNITLKFI